MSRYSPASLPLRRLLELAVHPSLTLTMIPRTGGSVTVHTMPVHFPPGGVRPNRHNIAPTVNVSRPSPDEDHAPYSPHPRFQVLATDAQGITWVSLNSPTDEIPPPPDRFTGPIDCWCTNVDGAPGPRYGDTQLETWHFCPHWLDDTRPGLPFIPDLFWGAGPCLKRDYPGVLQQWNNDWIVDASNGYVAIHQDVSFVLQQHAIIDESVLAALGLRSAATSCAPPTKALFVDELKQQWARFVAVTLERRGRALERLSRGNCWTAFRDRNPNVWHDIQWAGYYDYVPLGVWIRDTPARVQKIRQLLEIGVPVYYMWREDFWEVQELQPLAPKFSRVQQVPQASPPSAPGVDAVAAT